MHHTRRCEKTAPTERCCLPATSESSTVTMGRDHASWYGVCAPVHLQQGTVPIKGLLLHQCFLPPDCIQGLLMILMINTSPAE